MDDEIYALYRRINNTQFLHSLGECALEELFVEVLDDSLLAFEVVDVRNIIFHRNVEFLQHLRIHFQAFCF